MACRLCGRPLADHTIGEFCRLGDRPTAATTTVTLELGDDWEETLGQAIRDLAERDPTVDAWTAARHVLDVVDDRAVLLDRLLVSFCDRELRARRRSKAANVAKRRAVSAKWQRTRDALLDRPIRVGGQLVPLRRLSAADCDVVADGWSVRAAAAHERSEAWRRLAAAIRDSGAATVGELDRAIVAEIVGEEPI